MSKARSTHCVFSLPTKHEAGSINETIDSISRLESAAQATETALWQIERQWQAEYDSVVDTAAWKDRCDSLGVSVRYSFRDVLS